MGTELLKEQYNILLNDQKNKLQKLKQKKLSGQQKKDKNVTVNSILLAIK